ncbi:MAG: hypothetical protein A3J51_05275 [Omnitrophica WOR_2 bacterium RIFCSPHIGHO2_02_FULL_45_21]|nr:MAG: hypothetical protein A3J51_05275 [Omnitrophica WOR_2 bacterium RIFCSPHIGHO2_02_FULL_45_21]
MNSAAKRNPHLFTVLRLASCVLCLASCVFCYAQDASKEEETLQAAKNAFEDGFYDLGLTLFGRFLDKYPESQSGLEANFYTGQCYFYQKKYNHAIKVFRSILDAKNTDLPKDRLYYWLAESFFKNNDFLSAYHFYEKLVTESPRSEYNAHSFYSLGWCLFEQGKFREAKEKFLEFRNKFPRSVLADEVDFKVVECLYNLNDYLQLKDYIVHFSAVQERSGKTALLKFYLAESYFYLEDYISAIDNYTKVLELTADSNLKNLAYLGLGWSHLKHNDFSLASANFEKVLKAQTKKDANSERSQRVESALLGKALCLKMNARYQEALDAMDELIEQAKIPSIIFEAHAGRAGLLYELRRYPDAVTAYKEAIDSSTTFSVNSSSMEGLRYGLGESEFESGDFNAAIVEFHALSEDAQDIKMRISSLVRLAQVYYASGDTPRAIDIYEKILKDYPDCQTCDYVQLDLALTLLNVKRYAQAIDLLKKLEHGVSESRVLEQVNFYLGKAYYESADYLNSQQRLSYFVSKYPSSSLIAEALFIQGSSLILLERFQDAYDILKLTLTYNQEPQLAANLELQMSDCLYELGRIDEALERLERLRSKYPDARILSLVLWRLSRHYFELNHLDLCRRYLLELVNSYPEASLLDDSYYLLGVSYERDGRDQEAIDSFLKIKTGKERMYPGIADLYKSMGKFQEAISYYRMSLAENVKDKSLVRFKLAESLEESGALGLALEEYAIISDEPFLMVKVMLRCGKIYERQEDWQSAIKMYEKITALKNEESKFANERIEAIKRDYLTRR